MGSMIVPANATRLSGDDELPDSLLFTVVDAQRNSIDLAIGVPGTTSTCLLSPKSNKCFRLNKGDTFRVPPGNCYRIENHVKKAQCELSWVLIITTVDKTVGKTACTETISLPLKTNTRSDQVVDNVIQVNETEYTSRKQGREPEVTYRPRTSYKDMSEEEKWEHTDRLKRESKARIKNRS